MPDYTKFRLSGGRVGVSMAFFALLAGLAARVRAATPPAKIDDANSEFLTIDSTAPNSSELGGLTPDAFFQGSGHVVTGAAAATTSPTQLLALPGGIIVVSVLVIRGSDLEVVIHNGTRSNLPAVQDGIPGPITLNAGADKPIILAGAAAAGSAAQLHLQIFPSGTAFPEAVTLILSAESPQSGGTRVVAQAFTGGV